MSDEIQPRKIVERIAIVVSGTQIDLNGRVIDRGSESPSTPPLAIVQQDMPPGGLVYLDGSGWTLFLTISGFKDGKKVDIFCGNIPMQDMG